MTQIIKDQTQSSKLGKVLLIILGLLIVVGDVAIYKHLRANRVAVAESKAPVVAKAPKLKIETVTTLGRLEPGGEIIQISASASAEGNSIKELRVKEGDEVDQGEVIAVLDSRDRLEAALYQAKEQVKVAQANLAQVKAGAKTGEIQAQRAGISRIKAEESNNIAAQKTMVSRMEAELNNAKVDYQRHQNLYQERVISASTRDTKYLAFATKKEQLAEAKANLNRLESSQYEQIVEAEATLNKISEIRPVDVAIVEAEVGEAQAAVKTAQAELNQSYIKSPQAGTIIEVPAHPGEVISSEDGIARIGQTKEMYAVAEVYESDIGKVKPGQKVMVSSNAIAAELNGKVERIGLEVERQEVVNTDPTSNIDAKVVEVKVKLDPESSLKVAGLTNMLVDVKIEL